jgi:GlpG protein
MRHIGSLPNEEQARLFGDYLFARGIRNQIERDGAASWMVWVADEEQLTDATDAFTRFRSQPAASEFARTAASAGKLRADEEKAQEAYRKRLRAGRQLFSSTRPYGAGLLTYLLIVVCLVVFARSDTGLNRGWLTPLFISDPGTVVGPFLPEVRHGEIWRLFTPMFIHFGWTHLIFNMLWLFQLGSMIEGLQGRWRFALLVAVLAVISNLTQYAIPDFQFIKLMGMSHSIGMLHFPSFGGMSGVIYGLFGYIWLRGKFDPASGLFIDRQNLTLALVWIVAGFAGWAGPVANMAHLGGLVAGAAYGYVTAMLARRI